MSLRTTSYEDEDGRHWRVLLPQGVPDEDADMGIPYGPPPLDALALPDHIAIRLHNELFNRGIFREADAKRGRQNVQAALMAALEVDVETLMTLYHQQEEAPNAHEQPAQPAAGEPVPDIHLRRRLRPGSRGGVPGA